MFRAFTLLCFLLVGAQGAPAASNASNEEWWRDTFIYQIYPRSFKDSNRDGVGDLNGITSKLEHLADIGVSALWISPMYTSPMADFGYDIANFTNVDPIFGTLDDFTKLTNRAKQLGVKVLLDFVPNHSSDKHPWFLKSVQKIKPYDDYYIWKDAKIVNGTRQPPNNWLSTFQGSAWEWNEQRGQYYYHEFVAAQPDLNYRNLALQQEMKDALSFWLDRGVDGFRIDAVPHLVEDARFLDEPVIPNTGLPATDPGTLDHIYTKDQPELYEILKSWRQLLDARGGEKKILLTEAYTSIPLTMKYYLYGSNAPMNFMFMSELNNQSRPVDFKRAIDRWMNNMPAGNYIANWVVGNHDNHRAASRFPKRGDQLSMLAAVLPGIGIIYNGDEIGMEDLTLSYAQTVDPAGCNAGPDRYQLYSRDPERTPFQWDATANSGFTTGNKTWLPVHPNYRKLNLEIQKTANSSHYAIFKKLVQLKKQSMVVKNGSSEVIIVGDNVLAVVRRIRGVNPVVLLINFSNSPVTIDAAGWLNVPEELNVYVASLESKIPAGTKVNLKSATLPGAASIILN